MYVLELRIDTSCIWKLALMHFENSINMHMSIAACCKQLQSDTRAPAPWPALAAAGYRDRSGSGAGPDPVAVPGPSGRGAQLMMC